MAEELENNVEVMKAKEERVFQSKLNEMVQSAEHIKFIPESIEIGTVGQLVKKSFSGKRVAFKGLSMIFIILKVNARCCILH